MTGRSAPDPSRATGRGEVIRLSDGFLAPPARAFPPRRAPPAGATDTHAHVFGPFERFPLAEERPYTPAETPAARYLQVLDDIGFERGVLVQGGAHGLDCRAMLDALDCAKGRLRGVALAQPGVSDRDLADMDRRGVRALRFARSPAGFANTRVGFDAFLPLGPRIAALGWHAHVQTDAEHLAAIADELLQFGFPIVVDHMCLAAPNQNPKSPEWRAVLKLIERGKIWMKLTPYRMSRAFPDHQDMRVFHDALVAANPERLLWGSDWPHVHRDVDMPHAGHLVDLLMDWTPAEVLKRVLVVNPAELCGF